MHSIQPFIAVMFHQTSLVQFHQFHPNMKPVVVAPGLLVVAGSVDSFNGQVDASLGLFTADRLNHHRGRRAGTRNLAQLSGGRMTGRFNSGL